MPGPVKVNVVVLIVEGFIASLKVATTTLLGHIPLAPSGGATEITVGAHAVLLGGEGPHKIIGQWIASEILCPRGNRGGIEGAQRERA